MGKNYELALKEYMSKAYDHLECDFIECVIFKLGFCSYWVSLITKCISSVRYSVLMARRKVAEVVPSKGLKQGDPLSPYLFIIDVDVLSNMVTKYANLGELKGIKLAGDCPPVSHCFFADDSLFFLKSDVKNAKKLRDILDDYYLASEKMANLDKSCLYLSPNMPQEVRDEISLSLGIYVDCLGKYLGLSVI